MSHRGRAPEALFGLAAHHRDLHCGTDEKKWWEAADIESIEMAMTRMNCAPAAPVHHESRQARSSHELAVSAAQHLVGHGRRNMQLCKSTRLGAASSRCAHESIS